MLNKKQIIVVWLGVSITAFIFLDLSGRHYYGSSDLMFDFMKSSLLILPTWMVGGLLLLHFEDNHEAKTEWFKRMFWMVVLYSILITPFIFSGKR